MWCLADQIRRLTIKGEIMTLMKITEKLINAEKFDIKTAQRVYQLAFRKDEAKKKRQLKLFGGNHENI